MCIVSIAWKAHPRWQLIAIGNRDELHDRPAEPAHRWDNPDHLLAGRDSLAGGTWLGVSEQGRFAVVTNLYGFGAAKPERASRGDLLKDFLAGHGRYSDLDTTEYAQFNPFNLITVTQDAALVHSNRPDQRTIALESGIHGLSNGDLHLPWAKSPYLNSALGEWLAGGSEDPERLFDPLLDQSRYPGEPDRIPDSPAQPEHSPIFVLNPIYGTRCSTVVAIDHDGQGIFLERRFDPSGSTTGESRLPFSWPGSRSHKN